MVNNILYYIGFNISQKVEYATYRVLHEGPKSMEMEYSILTLTAREIFF